MREREELVEGAELRRGVSNVGLRVDCRILLDRCRRAPLGLGGGFLRALIIIILRTQWRRFGGASTGRRRRRIGGRLGDLVVLAGGRRSEARRTGDEVQHPSNVRRGALVIIVL